MILILEDSKGLERGLSYLLGRSLLLTLLVPASDSHVRMVFLG